VQLSVEFTFNYLPWYELVFIMNFIPFRTFIETKKRYKESKYKKYHKTENTVKNLHDQEGLDYVKGHKIRDSSYRWLSQVQRLQS
jgi:hypothetical protein